MVSVQYSVRVEDRGLSKVETRTCISLPSAMQKNTFILRHAAKIVP